MLRNFVIFGGDLDVYFQWGQSSMQTIESFFSNKIWSVFLFWIFQSWDIVPLKYLFIQIFLNYFPHWNSAWNNSRLLNWNHAKFFKNLRVKKKTRYQAIQLHFNTSARLLIKQTPPEANNLGVSVQSRTCSRDHKSFRCNRNISTYCRNSRYPNVQLKTYSWGEPLKSRCD